MSELSPCPFCGKDFVQIPGTFAAVMCENVTGLCPISSIAISGFEWQNAYCWEELDKAHAAIRALREAIKILKKSLEHEIRCTACGFDECRKCYDCEAELALKQASSVLGEKE